MCDPNVAMAIQTGGGVFSAISEYQAGAEESRFYKYMASTAERNALLAEKRGEAQVSSIQDVASKEAQQLREEEKALSATQKVAQASSGIIGGVTAQDVTIDTFNKAKMDELMIRFNADVRSREVFDQSTFEAMNLRQQASQFKLSAKQAKQTGLIKARTGLLTTASQVAKTWYTSDKYKTTKKKGG